MQRILASAALATFLLAAGCPQSQTTYEAPNPPDTPAVVEYTGEPAATETAPPADNADSIAKLEALGVKLTRDKAGAVTGLDVVAADLKDADLELLKGLPSLVDIDLAKSSVTDAGLAALQSFPNLKSLGLQRCNLVTDAGLSHLESVPNLERLYLLYTLIGNDGMEHVAKLKKLKVLDLRGSKVSNAGLEKLREHPALVDIKLRASSIDDEALPILASIKQLRSIEAEDTTIVGTELGQLATLTDLQKLNLWRSYVDESSFAPLSVLTKLRDLRLRGTAVRATVLNTLAASKDSLIYLDLIECPINDDELAAIEPFQRLETLEIWQTNLGDAGLAHIGKLANLKSLDISICPNVTSAGMTALVPLSKLETLNLSQTGIDDAALDTLSTMSQLKSLDVRLTSVTDAGVAKFQAAVPNCKVTRQ
ncbi:MAG: hypothetical protein JNG89_19625 [Planctomycetaceae bacterium]|nr:hypothetical protein [Planctomycetaceae bacterium]